MPAAENRRSPLAELTGLPLYVLDMMQFKAGGNAVPQDEYRRPAEMTAFLAAIKREVAGV